MNKVIIMKELLTKQLHKRKSIYGQNAIKLLI